MNASGRKPGWGFVSARVAAFFILLALAWAFVIGSIVVVVNLLSGGG